MLSKLRERVVVTEAPASLISVQMTRERFHRVAPETVAAFVVPSAVNLLNLVRKSRVSALMTRDPVQMELSTDMAAMGTDVRVAACPKVRLS